MGNDLWIEGLDINDLDRVWKNIRSQKMRILPLSMIWYPFSSNKHDFHWPSLPSYASRIIFFKFHKVRLIVINPHLLLGGIDSYEPAVIVTDYDVSRIIAIESSESVVNNACVSLMLFVLQRHLMLFSEPLRSKSVVELDSSESLVSTLILVIFFFIY